MAVLVRGVEPVLHARLKRHKVVVLEGARAVGKTTVCRRLVGDLGGTYFDLADQATRQGFELDPEALLLGADTPVVVDEAQLIESLPLAVKRVVDRRDGNGQVLLTGSSRISRGALGGSDPLAGRASRVAMYPMTVGERAGHPVNVLGGWFESSPKPAGSTEVPHTEVVWRVLQGGLPGTALTQPNETTNDEWWSLAGEVMPAYVESALSLLYGKYDADRRRLTRAIQYLSANPAQILNVSRVANELEISRDTARRYIELLADSMLVHVLPGERPSAHKTLTAHPKLVVFDTAFAAWAARVPPGELLLNGLVWGGLVENAVALELLAQASWSSPSISVGHWRQDADEIDLVLTGSDGRLVGVEVKAATTVSNRDSSGLRALERRVGDRLHLGVVIYRGSVTYQMDDGMWAVPLTTLWEPAT